MEAIATRELTKVYKEVGKRGVRSLDRLTLTVGEGETYGFLGRNGAGKTTTIKILCSLLKPTSGEAFVFGESVRSRAARRLFGYLPEQPYFYEYLTPRETIAFYGQLQGMSRAARERSWDALSEWLDLRDIAGQRVKGFSKGMRQRVGFAVALVGDPPLLILDEPMSGLDPVGRRHIRELILRLRDEKKTIFFSSHVLSDVEQVCDRVAILVKGRLTRHGRLDELLTQEATQVEVVLAGLPDALRSKWRPRVERHRQLEERDSFLVADPEQANALVHEAQQAGAQLAEFLPVKESLEAYFMREQEAPVREESAA